MNAHAEAAQRFTVLDWLGTVVAGFSAVGLLLFPVAGRSFGSMFRDLGSGSHLPTLTTLAISGWFPMLLGLLVGTGVVVGVRPTVPLARRRILIVGAFVLGGIGFGLCLVGVYLPIFAIAGAVRAD